MNKKNSDILSEEINLLANELKSKLNSLGFNDVQFDATRVHMFGVGLNVINFTLIFKEDV